MKRQLLKKSSGTVCCDTFFSDVGGCSGSKETLVCGQGQEWCVQSDRGQGKNTRHHSRSIQNHGRGRKKKGQGLSKGRRANHGISFAPPQEQVEPMRRQHQLREEPRQQHLKQQQTPEQQQKLAPQQQQLKKQQAPQQQQQTDKIKGKAQEKTEGAKSSGEKVKEKTNEPIPSDKKN